MCVTTAISFQSSLAFVVVALAAVGLHRPLEPRHDPPIVTVLCYHTFDSAKITPYTVSQSTFREQMRFLAVQHIPVIAMPQLVAYLEGKGTVPNHSVVITIDDGYKSALTKAWPVVRRFGFPMTLFVYPQAISRHGDALTWEDLRYLTRHGVDVESHSFTHPLLTHPSQKMNELAYSAWLDKELAGSRREIEQRLGKPVMSLAYPYGGYDERIVEHTRAAGYHAAFTCDDGDVIRGTDALHLYRRLVFHGTRLKDFVRLFQSEPLILSDLQPRDGERVSDPPSEISARVMNWRSIAPETITIMVDKLGRHSFKGHLDPRTGRVLFKVPPNHHHGYFFVSMTARDRQVPAVSRETTWLFIVRRNASKN